MERLISALVRPAGSAHELHARFRALQVCPFSRTQLQLDILQRAPRPRFDRHTREILLQRLHSTGNIQLAAVSWQPGVSTQWHGHRGAHCTFCVISGELAEFVRHSEAHDVVTRTMHRPGSDAAVITDMIGPHCVVNSGIAEAVSLHLYTYL